MNKFDQHIKEKLSQPQIPPIDAWKNIENKLDQNKKKRIIPIWFVSSAACISLLVGLYFLMDQSNKPLNQPTKIVKNPIEKTKHPSKNLEEKSISAESESNIYVKKSESKISFQSFHSKSKKDALNLNFDINNSLFDDYSSNDSSNQISEYKNETVYNDNLPGINQKKNDKEINTSKNEKNLDEILKENEEKISLVKAEQQKSKLSISSYVSPIVLVNENSILSKEFDLNNIENKITTAYGANIAYQINDKIKIKGGLAKINLEQLTREVISSEPTLVPLNTTNQFVANNRKQNIRYNSASEIKTVKNQIVALNSVSEINTMNQQIEFLEIPLEVEYQLLNNNKFSIAATAGGSYYLLTKNNLVLVNPMLENRSIGQATNISDSHFSANAGIKIGYDINKKMNVSLQPNMRFFINQFQDSDQTSPALFGINLGLSFKIK